MLLPCCLVAFATCLISTVCFAREPYVPSADDEVIETLPIGVEPARLQELGEMMRRLQQAPDDLALATQVARGYVALARSGDDPYYYGRAMAALAHWDGRDAPPYEILTLRADIAQFNHDFATAVADLRAALSIRRADAQSWFNLAVIELVRGDAAKAEEACAGLSDAGAVDAGAICLAQVHAVTGRSSRAKKQFLAYIERPRSQDQALLVWAMTGYGELLHRLGELDEAHKVLSRARRIAPDDGYLLTAYCDLLLEMGRPKDVVRITMEGTPNDNVQLRKAIALKAIDFNNLDAVTANLEAGFRAARERGTPLHQREEAMYHLLVKEDAAGALTYAIENWRSQREPIDALLYVRAAAAAGNKDELARITKFYKDTRLEDKRAEAVLKR